MRRQMEKATFAYRLHFENEASEALAAKTVEYTWPGMDKVFFVSGGSEAVESCLKMARQYAVAIGQATRTKVISRFPAYHGSTLGALAVTGYTALSAPFAPMMQEMPKIPAPTAYLDRDDLTMAQRGLRYADSCRAPKIQRRWAGQRGDLRSWMPVGGARPGAAGGAGQLLSPGARDLRPPRRDPDL